MERQVSTIHINKFVDLPDGSTVQIVASGPLLTILVIQKQQNGSRVLYAPDPVKHPYHFPPDLPLPTEIPPACLTHIGRGETL